MKLYAYVYPTILELVLKEGYLSASKQENPPILSVYRNYAKSEKREDVIEYLENTFKGRFRSISCLTAPAPIEDYEHPYLDNLVKNSRVVSFDVEAMMKDGVIEAIYCKDCSETAKEDMEFENIYKVDGLSGIDFSPLNWHGCHVQFGSPFNVIRHYMLVLKEGIIPPKYITVEH
ncbi:MAG: hypothetical protein PHE89_06340 [Alphaproteobacteria bacterium]|nr:hypothetical protein [Alphaproteobacteria bacterium]